MRIKEGSIAAKVQEVVDDFVDERDDLLDQKNELEIIFKKVLDAKGFSDIEFSVKETGIIDNLIGKQAWNGQ